MKLNSPTCAFGNRPFAGEGVSLYATIGAKVQYRNVRLFGAQQGPRLASGGRRGGGFIKGPAGETAFGSSVTKTARVASVAAPTASIAWSVPAAYKSQQVSFDVRHYLNDLENESDNTRVVTVSLDANGNVVSAIAASLTLLSQEQRQGGVVRFRLTVDESLVGVQPILVRAKRTAGPSSPADATASYSNGQRFVILDTPALLDSGPYTYQFNLENGSTVLVALTGITVQADASGPPAPAFVTAAAS